MSEDINSLENGFTNDKIKNNKIIMFSQIQLDQNKNENIEIPKTNNNLFIYNQL